MSAKPPAGPGVGHGVPRLARHKANPQEEKLMNALFAKMTQVCWVGSIGLDTACWPCS
jgi:hypothetical protein